MESKEALNQTNEEIIAQEAIDKVVTNLIMDTESKKITKNYSDLSEVELINALRELLKNEINNDINQLVETIKSTFYKKHNALKEKERIEFLENQGDINDFEATNAPYAHDIKELLSEYRKKKMEITQKQELERESNLKAKQNIIEEIKALFNEDEFLGNTFHKFKDLQQKWHEIGQVPQVFVRDLWDNYHHNVEKFYDYIKINQELRDLDFRKNLDAKTDLCIKAEKLISEESVIKASGMLQRYHEQWREIGPVIREEREVLWNRFKEATSQINKKHQDFFLKRKEDEIKNLELKENLCKKVESIVNAETETYKDWDKHASELKDIQTQWRNIGYAPKKNNDEIYVRFCNACDNFFNKRREFYNEQKDNQKYNLQKKEELCEKVEALKDSSDWKNTTSEIIEIQKSWKEIGSVPHKQSDIIWKRFRAACDHFFERKKEQSNDNIQNQKENFEEKNQIIKKLNELINNDNATMEMLKNLQKEWQNIGYVPINDKEKLNKEYSEVLDACYNKFRLDSRAMNLDKFKIKLDELINSDNKQELIKERKRIQLIINKLTKELAILERNITFFVDSKGNQAMKQEVQRKIDQTKIKIKEQEEKIKAIEDI